MDLLSMLKKQKQKNKASHHKFLWSLLIYITYEETTNYKFLKKPFVNILSYIVYRKIINKISSWTLHKSIIIEVVRQKKYVYSLLNLNKY